MVHVGEAELISAFDGLDAAEVFRTSQGRVAQGASDAGFRLAETPTVSVEPLLAHGEKCARCWRVLPEVKAPKFLCVRCDEAVTEIEAAK